MPLSPVQLEEFKRKKQQALAKKGPSASATTSPDKAGPRQSAAPAAPTTQAEPVPDLPPQLAARGGTSLAELPPGLPLSPDGSVGGSATGVPAVPANLPAPQTASLTPEAAGPGAGSSGAEAEAAALRQQVGQLLESVDQLHRALHDERANSTLLEQQLAEQQARLRQSTDQNEQLAAAAAAASASAPSAEAALQQARQEAQQAQQAEQALRAELEEVRAQVGLARRGALAARGRCSMGRLVAEVHLSAAASRMCPTSLEASSGLAGGQLDGAHRRSSSQVERYARAAESLSAELGAARDEADAAAAEAAAARDSAAAELAAARASADEEIAAARESDLSLIADYKQQVGGCGASACFATPVRLLCWQRASQRLLGGRHRPCCCDSRAINIPWDACSA